jgi:uncharacterized RDD family membrane protein YckC
MTSRVEQAGGAGEAPRERAAGAGRAKAAAAARARTRSVRAPFSLRCGALLIDYTLVVGLVAFSTLLARLFGEGARDTSDAALTFGYFAAAAVAALNFLVLPVFTGRTLGKWATGLRVELGDGDPLTFPRALVRHTVGYLLSLLTLGFGFLVAAFSRDGRALHDLVAGTIVVRE